MIENGHSLLFRKPPLGFDFSTKVHVDEVLYFI